MSKVVKTLVKIILLGVVLCVIFWAASQWRQRRWALFYNDAVYFERHTFSESDAYYFFQSNGTLLEQRTLNGWLYTVPPGQGRSHSRWLHSLPSDLYSYKGGYLDISKTRFSFSPCLPGEGRIRWTPDGQFLATSTYILVYDDLRGWVPVGSRLVLATEDCHVQVVMVERKGWRLWDPDLSVRGLLAYARGPWDDDAAPREIVVRDFRHDKAWVIGEGVNPTWSPDGEWLVYTGYDGLYVARWDGSQKRRVLPCTTQESMDGIWGWEGPEIWWKWPPRPDWSPDGKWLIYHRKEGETYNIYRLNLFTGEEELLIQNGVHPQWRWERQDVSYPEAWEITFP